MPSDSKFLRTPRLKLSALFIGTLALGGCATFSQDGGFSSVEKVAAERLGKELRWAKSDGERNTIEARVRDLLAQLLSVEDAVQVALLNNRGLQAAYFELGISEADLVQAGRLPNPHFSMLRSSTPVNGVREYKIEQALTLNIFALITMPLAVEVEKRHFEQTQRQVAMDVLRLAAETRTAYFVAVAADETLRYVRRVRQAADAGAELARRMAQVGNVSKLRQAREQGFYAEATLGLARAEQAQTAARERLTRLLGLGGSQAFKLP